MHHATPGSEPEIRFCPVAYTTEWSESFPSDFLVTEVQPRYNVSAVFIVDVSLSVVKFSQIYEHLRTIGKVHTGVLRVVCIDHHQTALDRLDELRQYCTETDIRIGQGLSGATLVWEFFDREFEQVLPMPVLLRYVADQDTWEWRLDSSREVNAALNVLRGTVAEMRDELEESCSDPDAWIGRRVTEGRAILRMVNAQIWRTVRNVRDYECIGGVLRIVNSTAFNSETGNFLCEDHARSPNVVAVLYSIQEDYSVRCSIRSIPDGWMSARRLAEQYGGGGHEHAAGCRFNSLADMRRAFEALQGVC